MPTEEHAHIQEAMLAAREEIGHIPKESVAGLRYEVRGWETMLSVLSPILCKHGLTISVNDLEPPAYDYENNRCTMHVNVSIMHTTGGTISVDRYASHPLTITLRSGERTANNNPEGAARTYAERDAVSRWLSIPTTPSPELPEQANTVDSVERRATLDAIKTYLEGAKSKGDQAVADVRKVLAEHNLTGMFGGEQGFNTAPDEVLFALIDNLPDLNTYATPTEEVST